MQAAVPTVMQLQLAAASGGTLAPHRSKCVAPCFCIRQVKFGVAPSHVSLCLDVVNHNGPTHTQECLLRPCELSGG